MNLCPVTYVKGINTTLAEVGAKVEEDEAKAISLNNLITKYDNIAFRLSNMPSHFLGTMVSTLMAEENCKTDDEIDEDKCFFSQGKKQM